MSIYGVTPASICQCPSCHVHFRLADAKLYKHKNRKRERSPSGELDIGEPILISADTDQDTDQEPQEIDF